MSTAVLLITLILLGLLIIAVNISTLIVLCTCKRLIKPANYPIISFLIAGILQGCVVVPAYCVKRLELGDTWSCDVFRFSYFLCGHMLTLSVQLVAFDRVIAIRFPYRYSQIVTKVKSTAIIILTWLIFIVIDILPFIYGSKKSNRYCSYIPWAKWSIAVIVLTILMPLTTISCVYAWIWRLAIHHAKAIANVAPTPQTSGCATPQASSRKQLQFKMESRATKTSALLVGIFFICWAPIGIYYTVENLCGDCITNAISTKSQDDFKFAVKYVSYTSCIFTPLAYCWRTREFKRELCQALRKRGWKVAGDSVDCIDKTRQKSVFTTEATKEHESDTNIS